METTIAGQKFEITEQQAIRVERLSVGDKVRVLEKNEYATEHQVLTGVIVGFEPFTSLPSVVVALLVPGSYNSPPKIKMAVINEKQKKYELVKALDDTESFDYAEAIEMLERREKECLDALRKATEDKVYFIKNWGRAVSSVPVDMTALVTDLPE